MLVLLPVPRCRCSVPVPVLVPVLVLVPQLTATVGVDGADVLAIVGNAVTGTATSAAAPPDTARGNFAFIIFCACNWSDMYKEKPIIFGQRNGETRGSV